MNGAKYLAPGSPGKGSYHYYLNGSAQDINETWFIESDNDGRVVVHSQRCTVGGTVSLNVIAVYRTQRITAVHACYRSPDSQTRASYRVAPQCITARLIHDGVSSREVLRPRPPYFMFPLMRVFTGDLLLQLAGEPEGADILVPNIEANATTAERLRLSTSVRKVEEVNCEWPTGMSQPRPMRCFMYSGGNYKTPGYFWVDNRGLLVRYCWQQSASEHWDVRLHLAD